MHCGQIFNSFAQFEASLKQYENENKQKFVIKGSRSIQAAQKMLQRKLNEGLRYYEAQLTCVHGGKLRSRGKGVRNTRTHKMNCPASIKIRASKSGKFLEIKQLIEKHENHDMSQVVYGHLSSNRKLNATEKSVIEDLLDVRGNKKIIQQKIMCATGKMSTLKDLSNIAYNLKITSNDLSTGVKELQEIHKCNVRILHDSSNNFKALYFSTESMRKAVNAWPQFISLDGTYKLLNLGFTVFIVLVEDSNGQSEIVAVALIANEDRETFHWFLNTFKEDNAICEGQIKCIMGDKDLLQRNVIREVFPEVPVYICLFHTLKTMKREISRDKLNITNEERIKALELLQSLAYSRSEEQYNKNYEIFKSTVPRAVITYYEKNWHAIKQEWTVYSMCHGNLLNRTNNRLESINSKLKQVIQRNSSLSQFIKSFFIFLNSHEQERNDRTARLILTRPITKFGKDSCEFKYEEYLTSYASKYVLSQIGASEKVQVECKDNILHVYEATSKGIMYNVSPRECSCINFTSMFLPCKHIFAVRKSEHIQLFDKPLCHERWSKQFYLKHQRVTSTGDNIDLEPICITQANAANIQTVNQKRKKALFLTNSLAHLISLSSNSSFNYKIKVLQDIETFWREGHEVAVTHISNNEDIQNVNTINDEDVVQDIDISNMTIVPNVNIEFIDNMVLDYNISTEENNGSAAHTSVLDRVPGEDNQVAAEQDGNKNILKMGASINIISDIKLPPKIKTKGRPKGAELTVVGSKRKRKNNK